MNNQSFLTLTTEQRESITNNMVGAMQILYASVKARKEKEFVEKIQNERSKNGKSKRV